MNGGGVSVYPVANKGFIGKDETHMSFFPFISFSIAEIGVGRRWYADRFGVSLGEMNCG